MSQLGWGGLDYNTNRYKSTKQTHRIKAKLFRYKFSTVALAFSLAAVLAKVWDDSLYLLSFKNSLLSTLCLISERLKLLSTW